MTWQKQYNFSDTSNGQLNSAVLQRSINDSAISTGLPLLGINADIDAQTFDVVFTSEPDAGDVTTLDAVVAAHDGTPFVEGTQSVQSLGEDSTTLGALQSKISATSGPLSGGDYLLTCYCEIKTDGTGSAGVEAQVSLDGSPISEDNWDLAQWHAYQCSGVITVQDGDRPDFALDFRRIGAAATVSIRRARVALVSAE